MNRTTGQHHPNCNDRCQGDSHYMQPEPWPCDNYTSPFTCIIAGSTTPCDQCKVRAAAARGRAGRTLPPTLAAILTTLAACVGVTLAGAPAQAASAAPVAPHVAAPFSQGNLVSMWHQPHDGYHWRTDTGVIRSLPRISYWDDVYCHGNAECMEYIGNFYDGLRASWKEFSAEGWAAAAGLPTCAGPNSGGAAEADCLADTFGGTNRLHISGVDYYLQTTTNPATKAARHHLPPTKPQR